MCIFKYIFANRVVLISRYFLVHVHFYIEFPSIECKIITFGEYK